MEREGAWRRRRGDDGREMLLKRLLDSQRYAVRIRYAEHIEKTFLLLLRGVWCLCE